jgi:uncharacterized protein YndB with AHSA1/START domain
MYTVVAQRHLPVPPDELWRSLTAPPQLARWFADVDRLGAGEPFRFDFGDGDFFAGTVTEWEPGIVLGLRWRFLGLGPRYDVLFSLLRRKQGTELSIQDRGALSVEEAECLRVGWSEFLMRLEKSIRSKCVARFSWRTAINFTAIAGAERDRVAAALTSAAFYDETFGAATRVEALGAAGTRLTLTSRRWPLPTEVRVDWKTIRGQQYVLVAHEGWPRLPATIAEVERRRAVDGWLAAVRRLGVT